MKSIIKILSAVFCVVLFSAGISYVPFFSEINGERTRVNDKLIIPFASTVRSNDTISASISGISDIDGDTKIQVEESFDEDIIHFDVGVTEDAMQLNSGGLFFGTGATKIGSFNASDDFSVFAGGNDRLKFFTSGNASFGSSTDQLARLHVAQGNAGEPEFVVDMKDNQAKASFFRDASTNEYLNFETTTSNKNILLGSSTVSTRMSPMTNAERDALVSPSPGSTIFSEDDSVYYVYLSGWVPQGNAGFISESTTTINAEKFKIVLVDVSSGTATVNPPSSPNVRDRFAVSDSRANSATNNITIDFNTAGQNFHGVSGPSANVIMSGELFIEFMYTDDPVVGWIKIN